MARLDSELVARGIARSRERAKEMIKSGSVTVNGTQALKPSAEVGPEDELVSSETEQYVGRGALKLEKAVNTFGLDLTGLTCADIGASTGGFTEYMLSCGAAKVYAVDVGHGQLAQSLREDSRVVNMEGTDIRNISPDDIGGQVDFISADVSFISLKLILPKICELLKEGAHSAVLIKPQFEAGRKDIGKGGVVKNKKVHFRVLEDIDSFARTSGLTPAGYTSSPIKGGSGNIEYLVHLIKGSGIDTAFDLRELAESSFKQL